MKVELRKNDDGTWQVFIRKTRPKENPSMLLRSCTQEQLETELAKMIAAVAPTDARTA